MTDSIFSGFKFASIIFIITEVDSELMSKAIQDKVVRGISKIEGLGMYEVKKIAF